MDFKKFAKFLIKKTANNNLFWPLYLGCRTASRYLIGIYNQAAKYHEMRDPSVEECLREKFSDLTVRHGPFTGMRYPQAQAAGSTLLPKLLGSYESELIPVIEKILLTHYSTIVDIGCAEGYYAVGLGMRLPESHVYAFDTDSAAQRFCREMAEINGLKDRLIVGSFCDPAILLTLSLGKRALIVSDCEGYEGVLFNQDIAKHLSQHELLIEVHDEWESKNGRMLKENFARTHHLEIVQSIQDVRKVRTYSYPELEGCNVNKRLLMVAENRGSIMEWFHFTPRNG